MFADYKALILGLLLIIATSINATNAMADEKVGTIACGPEEECAALVPNDISEAKKLCPNSSMQIAWNRKSDWTLMSCPCNCSEQSNKNWFINPSGEVIELNVGRHVKSSFFLKALSPVVPDIMASHSMCEPADREMIKRSTFLLLNKKPSNEKDPYCYDVIYAVDGGGGIKFIESGASLERGNRDYFSSIDDAKGDDLKLIAKKITPSWAGGGGQAGEKNLAVVVKRAYLYDQPSVQGAGKAYLIAGDRVKVLGRISDGYVKFQYTTKKGLVIEKWLKCADINYCRSD
ncbi:hypothetical protein [Burkholderia gladioli]|uniref:hypothetical protein n=1 Tax=Burkholderia gladioli TaxID=28095 RepID=UPI001641A5FF|nr:hypothetical protein [Burkholderia gladioli]